LVLEELVKKLKPGSTDAWLKQINTWQSQFPMPLGSGKNGKSLKPQFVIRELSRLSGENTIVATDVGQHQMWSAQHFVVREPQTFLTSGGLGTMGYGFPAAIGARLAAPDKKVICITGDGSFQMNIQELATVVHNDLDMIIAVINNRYLGMVRQWQDIFYEKRYSYTSMQGSPDFVRVAEAYGAKAFRARNNEEATEAIEKALKLKGPVLIDFMVDPEENVYPMVAPNHSISDIIIGGERI